MTTHQQANRIGRSPHTESTSAAMTSSTQTPSVRGIVRNFVVILAAAITIAAFFTATDQARAATPRVASKSTTATNNARMSRALDYAITQKGDPYRYGGTGPSSWDCSGLVQWAYKRAGVSLPRTTQSMLGSSRLHRVSRSWAMAHRGTLAFWGDHHVEMVSSSRYKFGARHSGTRVGFSNWYGSPVFYAVY